MTPPKEDSDFSKMHVLTETEIQERLYGSYLGIQRSARKREAHPPMPTTLVTRGPAATPEPTWTGAEILAGELKRLRSELIVLRREKDHLQSRLEQISPSEAPRTQTVTDSSRWVSCLSAVVLLLGMAGYLFGVRALQASPAIGDATPYTLQVAVYDVKGMAERARKSLVQLGYDAFLVATPRSDGRPRYRVYVGSFVTKEEVHQEYLRLTGDPRFRDFKDAFVRIR